MLQEMKVTGETPYFVHSIPSISFKARPERDACLSVCLMMQGQMFLGNAHLIRCQY
jgi:hypothetical protein